MKIRRFALLILVIALLSCIALPTSAARLNYVTDQTGLLTQTELATLETKAADISSRYGIGVYIIVVNDYHNYSQYPDIYDAAVDIYTRYDLGGGSDRAGALLFLSMSERDYVLDFNTDRARYAFTEAGQDRLESQMLSYFRNDDFYNGFQSYLDNCDYFLQQAANGTPVGEGETADYERSSGGFSALALLPGIIVSTITGTALSAPMRSTGLKRDANQYAVSGSLQLHHRSDMFLHRSVTRTPRAVNNNRSGGGGSYHSSGTHSGRSGKF